MKCNGTPPSPRHGHLMVAVDNKIFIHGGMAEAELYSDLHVLDLGIVFILYGNYQLLTIIAQYI